MHEKRSVKPRCLLSRKSGVNCTGNEMLIARGMRQLYNDYHLDYEISSENAVKENRKSEKSFSKLRKPINLSIFTIFAKTVRNGF
jgi:hypothetical protein